MMKTMMIAAFLLAAPAAAFAQSAQNDGASQSKVNIAVRSDMAQAEASAETRSVGTVKARSARVGGRTIRLVDGSLPDNIQSAAVDQSNPGS